MFKRLIASLVCFTFIFSNLQYVHAQDFSINQLPVPGKMLDISQNFTPILVKGLIIHPDKPLNFDFIVDSGNDSTNKEVIKEQSERIAKYFLAAVTVPEDQLWVNLSPYEKDRIIENELGQTILGHDMLAQDYVLKQFTASLIYPEKSLGKDFWGKIYKETQEKFGTTDVSIGTFNKVWIMPDKAEVFENGNAVYVTNAKLKVMLDSDHMAMIKNGINQSFDEKAVLTKAVMRKIVIPAIEKEVNEGKNFSVIRQVYYAAILAKWYRELIQNTLLADAYVGRNRVTGITSDEKAFKENIYQRYIAAYKKGVFNYIKEEPDIATGGVIPRKYFSGGIEDFAMRSQPLSRTTNPLSIGRPIGQIFKVDLAMSNSQDEERQSMPGKDVKFKNLQWQVDRLLSKAEDRGNLRNGMVEAILLRDGTRESVGRFMVSDGDVNPDILSLGAQVRRFLLPKGFQDDDNFFILYAQSDLPFTRQVLIIPSSAHEWLGRDSLFSKIYGTMTISHDQKPLLDAIVDHVNTVKVGGKTVQVDYVDVVFNGMAHKKDLPGTIDAIFNLIRNTGKSLIDSVQVEVSTLKQDIDDFEGTVDLSLRDKDGHLVSMVHLAFVGPQGQSLDVESMIVHQGPLASAHYYKGGFKGMPQNEKANLVLTVHQALHPDNNSEVKVQEVKPLALLSTNRVPSGFGSAVSKNLANDNFVLKQDNQHWDIKKQGLAGAPSLNLPLLDPGNESPSTSPSVSLSNSTKPKRRVGVIYIGPGQYSLDESHLEAMKRLKGNVELIAVVNKEINENQDSHGTVLANDRLQVVRRKVRDFLRNELGVALNDVEIDVPDGQGDDLVKASLSDGRRVSDIITEKIKAFKEKEKKEGYDTEVAVIVGTRSRYHMPYVQWALENNFHVLVDKPLTTPRWSINDTQKVEQSDSIVTDAQKLLQLSQQHSNVLTTIATQKRYGEILGRIRKVLAQSSSPIKYLQLTTNDGWWVDPDSLGAVTTRGESFSLEGDGGKLAHTGYHIFDLVPLILNDPGINGAQVRVVFQRPEDIVAYNNLTRRMIPSGNSWMDMKGKLEFNDNLNPADFKGLMEINANIEIVLTRKNGSKVIVNLGMFHGGPSSNSTPVGRTKTETVTLINEKGSLETARVDKFLYKGQKIKITASSVEGIDGELCPTENGDSVEPGSEFPENARPALDFFNTLLYTNNLNNINSRVTSPLVSHTIGIKLMAAALKAGYSGQTVSFPIIPSEWSQVRHVLETEGLPVNNAVSDQHLQSSASEDSQHGDDFAMLPPDLEEAFKQEDITPALERLQLLVKENTKQYATAEIRDFLLRMIGKRKSINQELRKALRQAPIDMLRDIDYDPSIHYVLVKDIMPIWTILQNYGDPMIFSERVIEEYIVQGKARIERQLFNPYVRDSAQVANAPDTAMADVQKKGGIDIQNIDVVRKNGIMKIQFNDQAVRNVLKNGFNGFTPIVINVISIQNPLPLLGINFDKNERALVKV